jgi:hypothetical protein
MSPRPFADCVLQEEPFASRIPLQCSNQSGVFKWLEKWITHHAAGTAAAAAAAAAANKGNEQAHSGTISTGEGVRQWVRAP